MTEVRLASRSGVDNGQRSEPDRYGRTRIFGPAVRIPTVTAHLSTSENDRQRSPAVTLPPGALVWALSLFGKGRPGGSALGTRRSRKRSGS